MDKIKMTTDPRLRNKLQESPYMTVTEVAAYMRVSRMTIYRLVNDGTLPAIRIARSFRVHVDEVDKYVERWNSR
jgi:excisionase family DNA binding protein